MGEDVRGEPFLLTLSDRSEIADCLRKTAGLASYGRIGSVDCLVSLKVWQSFRISLLSQS